MSELVNMGYLSDYYKSPSFNKVIEVLPNARFAYPQDENTGLSKYAKYVTKDRLEHPAIYDKLNAIVKELDYREYEEMFKNVFISEFGVEFKHFSEITIAIIRLMQDGKQGIWIEEIGSFKKKISTAAQVNVEIVEAYITAFSISPAYQDLSYLPMFKEYDTSQQRIDFREAEPFHHGITRGIRSRRVILSHLVLYLAEIAEIGGSEDCSHVAFCQPTFERGKAVHISYCADFTLPSSIKRVGKSVIGFDVTFKETTEFLQAKIVVSDF